MNSSLTRLDWLVIGAYGAVTLGIGLVFARRAGQNTGEFFLGGRKLPWWLAGTSMVATSFAADTPLYVTGLVRTKGIWWNWVWWVYAASHMFSLVFLARLWRRAQVTTDVELAAVRYSGKSASFLRGFRGLVLGLAVNSIVMSWVFLAGGIIVEVTLGLPQRYGIPLCVGFALFYAGLAGIWGVVVTDLFQFVIALAGAVMLAFLAVGAVGGTGPLVAALRDQGHLAKLSLLPAWPKHGLTSPEFWESSGGILLILLAVQWWAWKNSDGGGPLIQRMSACRDERQSYLAVLWFNVAHYCLRPWPWILVALASLVLLPGVDHEKAYPLMMVELLPAGLRGLMFASLLAAFMSTIDTYLNLSAAYLVNDVYRPFVARDRSERHYVAAARLASLVTCLLALAIASRNKKIQELFHFMLGFGSGVGAVYLLRWFWWRINATSEIAGLAASTVLALLFKFHPWLAAVFPFPYNVPAIAGLSAMIWLPATFLTRPVDAEQLERFYLKVRPFGAWDAVRGRLGLAPPPASRGLWLLAAWFGGSLMIVGGILWCGHLLLGETGLAMLDLVLAAGGGLLLFLGVRATEPQEQLA